MPPPYTIFTQGGVHFSCISGVKSAFFPGTPPGKKAFFHPSNTYLLICRTGLASIYPLYPWGASWNLGPSSSAHS